MLKKILSGTGTALSYLLELVKRYPLATIILILAIAITSFTAWRLQQPFDQMQPILFVFGLLALLIGGISLLLERRDPQGTRFKTVFGSIGVILFGLTLGYLGIRLV